MRAFVLAASVAALLVSMPGAAPAAEVDFSTVLLTEEGKPFTDCAKVDQTATPPRCEQTIDVTLGVLVRSALNRPEQGMSSEEAIRRGLLARDIQRQPKQKLSVEDVKTIKDAISKIGYSPVLMLGAFELLDPDSIKQRK